MSRTRTPYRITVPGWAEPVEVSRKAFETYSSRRLIEQTAQKEAKVCLGVLAEIRDRELVLTLIPPVAMRTNAAAVEHWYLYAHAGGVPLPAGFETALRNQCGPALALRVMAWCKTRQRAWVIEMQAAGVASKKAYLALNNLVLADVADFLDTLHDFASESLLLARRLIQLWFAPVPVVTEVLDSDWRY
jgi:hypothetical protein